MLKTKSDIKFNKQTNPLVLFVQCLLQLFSTVYLSPFLMLQLAILETIVNECIKP